jgi:hypothetical protein
MVLLKHRVRAILGFSTTKIAILLLGAKNIYTKMSAAVQQFPSPVVSMAALLGLIQALEAAQPAVVARTKGASTIRNNAVTPLVVALQYLLSYVQNLCDLSPDLAATIIAAAGMRVHANGQHLKAPLTLTNGKPSGTVILRAFAALLTQGKKHGSYSWSYSVDGEKTWLSLPSTSIASTTITGLTPATTVAARVAVAVGKQPLSAWSAVVTLVVA